MDMETEGLYREAETRFLEALRPQYLRKGYDFVIYPKQSDLPEFLSSYVPDAIATKAASNIAIEVLTRSQRDQQPSIQRIRELFEGHPEWQFIVAYTGGEPLEQLSVSDRETILNKGKEVRALSEDGHNGAAYIVAWSLLEAALNLVNPKSDKRPQRPGTVIQTLAMHGFISAEREVLLRPLVEKRNRLVHGDLSIEPSQAEVDVVLDAVRETLEDA